MSSVPDWLKQVETLAARSTSREIAILANAVVHLARHVRSQRDNNLSAFEQIQELDRRQVPNAE